MTREGKKVLKDSLLSPKWVRMPAVPPYESPASHFIQLHFFQILGSQIWSLQNINMSQVDQAGMARDCILCVCVCVSVCVCVCASVPLCLCASVCISRLTLISLAAFLTTNRHTSPCTPHQDQNTQKVNNKFLSFN